MPLVRRRLATGLLAAAAALALAAGAAQAAGPGAAIPAKPLPSPLSRADSQWLDDARRLVSTVQGEVGRMASSGGTVAGARALLASGEGLFDTAISYGVFGICATRLHDIGSPGSALRPLEAALRAACTPLAQASSLFTTAVSARQPATLVKAEKLATTGLARLRAAGAKLDAYRKTHP